MAPKLSFESVHAILVLSKQLRQDCAARVNDAEISTWVMSCGSCTVAKARMRSCNWNQVHQDMKNKNDYCFARSKLNRKTLLPMMRCVGLFRKYLSCVESLKCVPQPPLKHIFTGHYMAPWEISLEPWNATPTFRFICCFRGAMLFKNHYPDGLRPARTRNNSIFS